MEGRVRLRAVGGRGWLRAGGRGWRRGRRGEGSDRAVGGVALVGGLVLVPGDFGDAGEEVEVAGEDEEIVGEAVYVADEFGIYVCFFG